MGNITVYDGSSTPASVSLIPIETGKAPDGSHVSKWRDTATGVPVEAQIRVTISKIKMKNGVTRVSTRSEIPKTDAVTGAVVYVDTFDTVSYSHPLSTSEGHRRVRMIGVNLANNVGTSTAAAISGPVPTAHDELISPV